MTQSENSQIIRNADYSAFLKDVKQRIQSAQIKAAVRVNQELLGLYWDLGEQIIEKQREAKWGDGFLEQMSRDLLAEFPGIKGFSFRNLKHLRQWVQFWMPIGKQLVSQLAKQPASQSDSNEFVRQLVAQIPWGHNILILQKVQDAGEALFYVRKTIENNWSRAVLTHQIEGGLYQRDGKAITNFEATLPAPQSDLAIQTLKDPYNFDFLMLRERHDEKELEDALTDHLTRFLLELGAGFSFLGRQFRLEVGGDEFFADLLFYHVRLHCYVVVELKTDKFKPEFAGKLNFYISAVDNLLKAEGDHPTIGILICKSKNDTVVEYSLKDVHKPIGVSEYLITQNLPNELRSSLPSIEEIEAEVDRDFGLEK
ncbi:MAG: PDDEXK nuclease domain-containing protein [Kiritimatiellales bacterium]|nr:PDDEXK nuclease domain-containing protein [Kiritimatiellales bacterium]